MKYFYALFGLLLLFFLMLPSNTVFGAPLVDDEAPEAWEQIAPGIDYRVYHLTNPRSINIFVTRMARDNPNVTIESSIGQGRLAYDDQNLNTEQVSRMAARYDQAINYWGDWGNRNNVAVAINGYFFGQPYESPGVPWSGQVHSGWYAKRYSDFIGDAGFAWMMDGDARIGSCVSHNQTKQFITFTRASYLPKFQGINVVRSDENIVLYTPQYDMDTNTSGSVLEILVEMTQPAALVATPNMATGYIREIRESGGSTPIPFDHVVISAWGDVRSAILSRIGSGAIAIGDEVGISQEISNCPISEQQFDWTNTYAGIGGDYHFLNDGVVRTEFSNPDATYPNSRTAIAYNADYIFFMVVDRWNPGVSMGITIPELGNFAKVTLGATDAISQDSGGSSTMVVNGQVVNNTYCNWNNCQDALEDSGPDEANIPRGADFATPDDNDGFADWNQVAVWEPYVANGMMMVAVEPLVKSTTFLPEDLTLTDAEAKFRLGPGNNYAAFDIIQPGNTVEVLPHINNLNGVLAKGSYWWKVAYGGSTGWVREQDLVGGQAVTLTADFTASPITGLAPLTVEFTNTSIGWYDSSVWDFGDGGSSVEASPSYVFNTPGIFTVTLTVSSPSAEDTKVEQAYIAVYEPVQADFTAWPSIGTPPLQVSFTDTSTGDYTERLWTFHDGSTSTETSPVKVYPSTGIYSVKLMVSGPGGTETLDVPTAVGVYDQVYSTYLPVFQ